MSKQTSFSEFITDLPQAALPMAGITGYLLSAPQGQVVFFELPAGTSVPLHNHGAQWGIVVSGELELTIGDKTEVYRAGESYSIPAGVDHAANVLAPTQVIDVFADPNRYAVKG
ncbi:MAG: cupin domain-containing protein [Proteobacteria bacterium]|nr:cupin domain-containing protein [Pseudomonadota bacterium]MBU1450570.1 cupin domain-containing protein [Pseudomonadota bacterium]MBU2470737.1 cupin domain-containing protein [Pseudomonadota bacterium]MBU2519540.1 cupin domain-containing protein [Pseudomonadota bacterium]